MTNDIEEQTLTNVISKIQAVSGIDVVYFLDNSYNLIKEKKLTETKNYIEEVINILKSNSKLNSVSSNFLSNSFHTCTFLNELGLIIIAKVDYLNLYLIVIAGENEPVDLLNLLKICKEIRLSSTQHSPVSN